MSEIERERLIIVIIDTYPYYFVVYRLYLFLMTKKYLRICRYLDQIIVPLIRFLLICLLIISSLVVCLLIRTFAIISILLYIVIGHILPCFVVVILCLHVCLSCTYYYFFTIILILFLRQALSIIQLQKPLI